MDHQPPLLSTDAATNTPGVGTLPGRRHDLLLPGGGRMALLHLAGPVQPMWQPSQDPPTPLLVVHSVHAAASAFEMAPTVLREARRRPVVAIDLPGFGASDKPDQAYTPQRMQQAIAAAIGWTQRHVSARPLDLMALSLGCEFAAQVVLQQPQVVRTLALIGPTGMEGRRVDERYEAGRTREQAWLRRLLRGSPVGGLLYRLLCRPTSMRWFLARSWGTAEADPQLLAQGLRCAAQPGACRAPLDFIAGSLFTRGIVQRYRALPLPVWVAHGRHGSFSDFGACPQRSGGAEASHPVERTVFDTGAMPHFQQPDAFDAAYQRFLNAQLLVAAMARTAASGPARAASTWASAASSARASTGLDTTASMPAAR